MSFFISNILLGRVFYGIDVNKLLFNLKNFNEDENFSSKIKDAAIFDDVLELLEKCSLDYFYSNISDDGFYEQIEDIATTLNEVSPITFDGTFI